MFGFLNGLSAKAAVVAVLALSGTVGASTTKISPRDGRKWVSLWGTMPQLTEPANLPPAPFNETGLVFADSTIRQTVKVTLESDTIRLQISNVFGGSNLPITSATIALPPTNDSGGSAINPSTLTQLTFSGSEDFIVPNGASVLSDPVRFPVKSGTVVTVSIYLASGQTTNSITSHPGSRTTSWFVRGNHVGSEDLEGASSVAHWYFISSIEGRVSSDASAVVIVGDSITDGRGSTTDKNDRWPDQLVKRLQKDRSTRDIAVINQGAGGNRVLADGLGPNALGRIDRDVIAMPGTGYAIIYNGVNDIGTAAPEEGAQKELGDRLIAAYEQIVDRLHRFGIPAFGATITPITGSQSVYNGPEWEATRQRVNEWIRTSGRFDAVVDFDKAVRDPKNPEILRAEYNSGDDLHLNPKGYEAMAAAIDLKLFKKFRNGV
ncbi:related to extracellular GDSL-like lipase/acylhydrolase [Cephalotrichum gorgonifer]|uniref:Related to extracellular GDSL-like lipase/acylhydrolase n=1 Tax=Cephalotrichum gorgonifer TaxID=2041049 RepID=A0AAE8MQL0_9PEZI|nr:related to extracellular GDSL-like lipase/acylhydrolase [Cephalotrichum gorgonifer]